VTLKFEVAPRCELGKYRGIKVERPVLRIADKQVKEAIEQLRERNATFEAVKGKAKEGDQVVIDFEGTLDGKVIAGGKAENYPYILGSGRFFKEFEEAIAGHKAGDEVTADVAFPEDYHGKEVAGKTVGFAIKIHEVKRKALPEVDEEFAKTAGFESVDEMKEKIAADLR
jgi:trigger factor